MILFFIITICGIYTTACCNTKRRSFWQITIRNRGFPCTRCPSRQNFTADTFVTSRPHSFIASLHSIQSANTHKNKLFFMISILLLCLTKTTEKHFSGWRFETIIYNCGFIYIYHHPTTLDGLVGQTYLKTKPPLMMLHLVVLNSMNMPAFLYCRCNIYITGFDTPHAEFPVDMQNIRIKKPTNVGFFILILQE